MELRGNSSTQGLYLYAKEETSEELAPWARQGAMCSNFAATPPGTRTRRFEARNELFDAQLESARRQVASSVESEGAARELMDASPGKYSQVGSTVFSSKRISLCTDLRGPEARLESLLTNASSRRKSAAISSKVLFFVSGTL